MLGWSGGWVELGKLKDQEKMGKRVRVKEMKTRRQ